MSRRLVAEELSNSLEKARRVEMMMETQAKLNSLIWWSHWLRSSVDLKKMEPS
jgi:hypothetical protein